MTKSAVADLATFTGEILKGKLHFLCGAWYFNAFIIYAKIWTQLTNRWTMNEHAYATCSYMFSHLVLWCILVWFVKLNRLPLTESGWHQVSLIQIILNSKLRSAKTFFKVSKVLLRLLIFKRKIESEIWCEYLSCFVIPSVSK